MSRDSFLSRWSRRKAEARHAEREPEHAAPPAEASDEDLPAPAEPDAAPVDAREREDEEPLDLPDIDSLTAESDYTVFLKEKVPAALRKQALRKLWRSDPVLANLDGLNDYDDDYSTPAVAGAAVRTAYNALRGYARPEEEEVAQTAQGKPEGASEDAESGHEQPDAHVATQQDDEKTPAAPDPSQDVAAQEKGDEKRDET
ncbi:hypothetical protein C882_0327 [Caenispirillum salinarum AK4]|uniref:DUF3306 domain-containing protein n=1 Tax=Caenispirillum salinarum AK4 TaxID=1238182 RepID=K9GU49_9PROT|nr:DUF3306 domain-containing protein [Caenispirillum salinarum]EKV29505.1 hypothetical protein C882_0327 [Caenispirillum salinarum AK4]